jgi:hypothetical protein
MSQELQKVASPLRATMAKRKENVDSENEAKAVKSGE